MLESKKNNKHLIISHNALSAGTSSQTLNLINHLIETDVYQKIYFVIPKTEFYLKIENSNKNIVLNYVPYAEGITGFFVRLYVEIFLLPFLIFKIKPSALLVLTNYFFVPFLNIKKIILVRHPYLFEKNLDSYLTFKVKLLEIFRRVSFTYTVKLADHIIVQSDYMKNLFLKKYSAFDKKLTVLPNPINRKKLLKKNSTIKSFSERKNVIVYPSRYYPHKNHEFLLDTVENNLSFFKENHIKVVVTLGNYKDTKHLLQRIENHSLDSVIENIGEVPQHELSRIYENSKILFFPSRAETFGNALVEGLFFHLPIVVPELPYAKTICGPAGIYYDANSTSDAFKHLKSLLFKQQLWENQSTLSAQQKVKYLDLEQWIEEIIRILKS